MPTDTHQRMRRAIIADVYDDCVAAVLRSDDRSSRVLRASSDAVITAASRMFAAVVTRYPGELVLVENEDGGTDD